VTAPLIRRPAVALPMTLRPRSLFGVGLLGVSALAVVAAAGRVVVPVAVQQALDHLAGSAGAASWESAWSLVAIAGLALCVAAGCAALLQAELGERAEPVLHTLRSRVFRRLSATGSGRPTARQVERLVEDVDQASQFIRWTAPSLLINAACVVAGAVVMLWYSWLLTGLVGLVAAIVLARDHLRRIDFVRRHRASRRLGLDLWAALRATVLASAESRSAAARHSVASNVERLADRRDERRRRIARDDAITAAGNEVAAGLVLAGSVTIGTLLVAAGRLTLGDLTGFVLVLLLVVLPALDGAGELLRASRVANARWRRSIRSIEP
jgi:putative ABC transport system ATP-binding protein